MTSTEGEISPGSFEIEFGGKTIRVTHPPHVRINKKTLENWSPFKNWKATLEENLTLQHTKGDHPFHENPYVFQSLEILSVFWAGSIPLSMKVAPTIKSIKDGKSLPAVTSLRGGSVAMLMILRAKDVRDEKLVMMTEQPRVPAGSLAFWEIPSGMLDDGPNFKGAAAEEIETETGIVIPKAEMIDLTELALRNSRHPERNLKEALYPSSTTSDEYIAILLWEKELDWLELNDLRGKLTSKRMQGNMTTLRLVDYDDVWREGARDAKTLAAWTLYEGLSREGILQEEFARIWARQSTGQDVED